MHAPTVGYALLAGLVTTVVMISWLSWRYNRYLRIKRSADGRVPKPVWKPFWFH